MLRFENDKHFWKPDELHTFKLSEVINARSNKELPVHNVRLLKLGIDA